MSARPPVGVLPRTGRRRAPAGLLLLIALLLAVALERSGPHGATPPLVAVAFSDPHDGAGLFQATGSSRCVASAGTTTDGGAHFGTLTVLADWRCVAAAPISAIASDGRGDLFAYGPALYASHDDGVRFARLAPPGRVLAIAARGRSLWLALRACARGRACTLRVLVSADGGRHWTPTPVAPGIDAPAGALSPLVRTGTGEAFALSGAALVHTSNGGASWQRRAPPCPRANSTALSAAPGGALVALCAEQPSAGSQQKWLERSTDAGRSWVDRGPCGGAITSACEDSPLTSGYLGEAVATSARTVYVIGDRSGLIVTRDGGRSWTNLAASVGDVNGTPAQVAFFGALDGVVLGRLNTAKAPDAIWHTTDGGRHWRALTPAAAS